MVVVERIIKCRVDITDVKELYCPDYKKMRIEKLNRQFVGYCYRSMFITSVEEIIKTSYIRTNSKETNGHTHMDIAIRVKGIVYEQGEIVPDVTVYNVTNSMLSASSKYADVSIIIHGTNILKINDVTPVIVKLSQYNISSTKLAIAAEPFLPKPISTITMYVCEMEYKENQFTSELKQSAKTYLTQLQDLNSDMRESAKFFTNLVYPYKETRSWSNFNIDKINIKTCPKSIIEFAPMSGNVIFQPENRLDDANIYLIDSSTITKYLELTDGTSETSAINTMVEFGKSKFYKIVTMKITGTQILNLLLKKYIMNLHTLLELSKAYPNKATINKSSHIWNFYNMNKKE